jgi:hypothetical protein
MSEYDELSAPTQTLVPCEPKPESVPIERVLRTLGFREDPTVLSDGMPGLSYDFGTFRLEASQGVNRWLRPVAILGGLMATNRTSVLIHFQVPLEVESFEQGVALITYTLDSHSGGRFEPPFEVPWLRRGDGLVIYSHGIRRVSL